MKLISLIELLIFVTLTNALPTVPLGKSSSGVQLYKKNLKWDYQNDKVRGVNLGGWFVIEPFITPSLFDVWSKPNDDSQVPVDEYHYTQKLGKEVAKQRLETHWKTWITQDDISKIKQLGLNFVRIPIGYWAFQLLDDDPYVQGQEEYLDKVLDWCRDEGLYAWIDLHGAPGSQNGFDNSGLRDSYKFQDGNNTQVTLQVLDKISSKYGVDDYDDVVAGIELLNEPLGTILDMNKLKYDYYDKGYQFVRHGNDDGNDGGYPGSDQAVVIHDAFQDMGYWDDFFNLPDYYNVVVDHHHYQVFSGEELERSIDDHISVACNWGSAAKSESHWNLVGEWSAALTDCARWLNGVGKGARWSGDLDGVSKIGSCQPYLSYGSWPDSYRTDVRKYIEAQLDAYEQAAGWIYWTWKTEDAVEWDFQRLTKAGIFPSPVTDRTYPNQYV
ncbi:hypothetical protein QCA50_020489 [Cerrena zonata]|uniref:glucan 1,3-beta-glucosidase n=1 Tax=Cerrena zonata TaxID=2478898 RepID=A0AAW0FCI1_9APHY